MRIKKDDIESFILKVIYFGIPILLITFVFGYLILWIYCINTYGDKSITEIPTWVWIILHNAR